MDLTSDEVHYDGAYRESANFLDFVERKCPGTVRELNALCRQGKYDEETYWKKRTGKGVKELETEWKNQSKQPFRNYRFCVDRTKCPSDSMQLSEFELLDADGKVVPSEKFELGFDGRGGDGNFGDGEKPECAVDGNLDTKWLDFRASAGGDAARRSAVWIQFKFAEPTKLSGYRWYTANDFEERDPCSWRFLGSNDGANWVVVDKVDGFEATSDRKKLAFSKESKKWIRFSCDNDVLTRAYEVAINDALMNVHMFQDGALTEPARCIMAGEVYDTPWTRDAAINVWNEAKGSYDYLAGECDCQEALGISYALLFGIADERQTRPSAPLPPEEAISLSVGAGFYASTMQGGLNYNPTAIFRFTRSVQS